MRKQMAIAACALLLASCESFGDLNSDAFDPGDVTQARFTLDAAECEAKAETVRSYNIAGISGTHMERHEMFNRAYAACMRKDGYARRDWSPDIAVPYNVDPTPG